MIGEIQYDFVNANVCPLDYDVSKVRETSSFVKIATNGNFDDNVRVFTYGNERI